MTKAETYLGSAAAAANNTMQEMGGAKLNICIETMSVPPIATVTRYRRKNYSTPTLSYPHITVLYSQTSKIPVTRARRKKRKVAFSV